MALRRAALLPLECVTRVCGVHAPVHVDSMSADLDGIPYQ